MRRPTPNLGGLRPGLGKADTDSIKNGVKHKEQGTAGLNYTYVPRSRAQYPPDLPRNYGSGVSDVVFNPEDKDT